MLMMTLFALKLPFVPGKTKMALKEEAQKQFSSRNQQVLHFNPTESLSPNKATKEIMVETLTAIGLEDIATSVFGEKMEE